MKEGVGIIPTPLKSNLNLNYSKGTFHYSYTFCLWKIRGVGREFYKWNLKKKGVASDDESFGKPCVAGFGEAA